MRDFIGLQLGITTRHDQDGIRVLASDTMNHLPIFMISGIGDGASVDDTEVCRFTLFGARMPTLQQRLT
jgi:hypothetical protein